MFHPQKCVITMSNHTLTCQHPGQDMRHFDMSYRTYPEQPLEDSYRSVVFAVGVAEAASFIRGLHPNHTVIIDSVIVEREKGGLDV